MSMDKNYYVIAGFDLTRYKTDKYEDWRWEDDGEKFTCYQRKGMIQLFDDPMSSDYLYLGYILAAGDQYEFTTTKFDIIEVENQYLNVQEKLNHLSDVGVINIDFENVDYKIIAFEECT